MAEDSEFMTIKRQERPIFVYIILSLLLHGLTVLSFNRLTLWREHKELAQRPTEIEFIKIPIEEHIKQQVVETDLLKKSERIAKDAYLGQQTQTVEKETRAAKVASFHGGKTANARAQAQSQDNATAAQPPTELGLKGIAAKVDFKPLGHMNPQERPNMAATNDYLKDKTQGAQTVLNTKEFVYFSFYQRVRRQLEQFWEPGLKVRLTEMFRRGRTLAAEQEHVTKLLVLLGDDGVIKKVQVRDTSGVLDLDEAAIDAFNKAGPFPNPPKGMIEQDGLVRVEWEFVLRT